MDDIVDQDFAFPQPIPEWFDFIRDAKREVMISKGHTSAWTMAKRLKETRDVDVGADIEVRLVEADKEFKQIFACPSRHIEVLCHAVIVPDQFLFGVR